MELNRMVVERTQEPEASRLRAGNAARCAVALRDGGRATVAQVATRTGLSRPTVEAALSQMGERGIVREVAEHTLGGRGAGRPARLYEFAGGSGYAIGVDVGIHRIRVAVADLAGAVVAWADEAVDDSFAGPGRMQAVEEAIDRCLDGSGVDRRKLLFMTVAVSGLVGENGRLLVSRNFPDWEGVDVAGHLRTRFGCDVMVENDMRLAALAEHRMGAARMRDDVVYFFAGHRISMGLIIGGRLRRGSHSAAGEVGDIVFSKQVNARGQLTWSTADSGEEVFRRAIEGDADSIAEIERFVGGLATGIATVAMAIDPDVVVVGGGLSRAGDALLEPLRRAVWGAIPLPIRPPIIESELGAESVVLGALALAFAECAERVYGVADITEPHIDIASVRTLAERVFPS
ncbi:ROK family protein [Leifsonia sp. NPDC058292]|uniref:ROK family transcriptional regulator n=1 Tax=Leifsonia sp. NPDC058292 TaxID=3346428 RepID=UPI0036DB3FFF